MLHLTRRQMLATLGAGWLAGRSARRSRQDVAVAGLAQRIRRTPRREIVDLAGRLIRDGVRPDAFLAGVFLAGVDEISPWPCGNDLHAVMVVDSVQRIAATGTAQQAWLAALWSADYFKDAQAADARTGDRALHERPAGAAELTAGAARKELDAAFAAWDWKRGDRAITALVHHHDRAGLFEILWPWAGRCIGSLAHKVIYVAQAERTLARIGQEHAEPVVRSVVKGLFFTGGRSTAASDRAHEVAERLPSTWLDGEDDPEASRELLRGLRAASLAEAQDLVIAAFGSGLGPQTVWDGLRLFAAELFARRSTDDAREGAAILPVHMVTATHAFAHAFRSTRIDATRRLLVLQAAGWLIQLRDQTTDRVGLASTRRGTAIPYDQDRTDGQAPVLRHDLFRAAVESHQYKLAVALTEEAAHAAPRWRPHLLGSAKGYLPPPGSPATELAGRCERMLRKAGIG